MLQWQNEERVSDPIHRILQNHVQCSLSQTALLFKQNREDKLETCPTSFQSTDTRMKLSVKILIVKYFCCEKVESP